MKSTAKSWGSTVPSAWPSPKHRWLPDLPSLLGQRFHQRLRHAQGPHRFVARTFEQMGFKILATRARQPICRKGASGGDDPEGQRRPPHVVDYIKNGDIQLVINVSAGRRSSRDAYHIGGGPLSTTCCTRPPSPGRSPLRGHRLPAAGTMAGVVPSGIPRQGKGKKEAAGPVEVKEHAPLR